MNFNRVRDIPCRRPNGLILISTIPINMEPLNGIGVAIVSCDGGFERDKEKTQIAGRFSGGIGWRS
jgi:hypothetical protein